MRVWLGGQVRDADGEFGADEEAEVEEPGPGEGGVAAGEGFKRVVHEVRVRVGADVGRYQYPAIAEALAITSYTILVDIGEVRLTPCDAARPWLAKQQLHALSNEESDCKR